MPLLIFIHPLVSGLKESIHVVAFSGQRGYVHTGCTNIREGRRALWLLESYIGDGRSMQKSVVAVVTAGGCVQQ